MGYALLWIEDLVFWSCFWALGVALASRIERRRRRWLVLATFMAVPLLFLGAIVAFTAMLQFNGWVRTGLFIPSVSLLTLFLAFGATLGVRGLRRTEDGRRQAARWELRTVGLTTLGALLVHALTFWNLDLAVRQQMDGLRVEAGALATSVAPPPVSDRENAAFLYQQAFDGGLVGKKPAQYERWLTATTRPSPRNLDERTTAPDASEPAAPFDPLQDVDFITYVVRNSEMCRLLREAAARPSCNFARDWGRPSFAMLLQETQNMRGAARDLQLEAHYAAARNMLPLAFTNLVAMHQISDHVGQEPLLVSLLVSFAIDAMAVSNLELLLQQYPASDESLDKLQGWRPIPAAPRLQRALRMEEAFGIATMCQVAEWRTLEPQAELLGIQGWGPSVSPVYRVFMMRDDIATYQEFFRLWNNASQLPAEPRKQAHQQINASLKSTPGGVMSRLLLPAIELTSDAAGRADANQRLAQLAIAAHRYRNAKGMFPESIEELVSFSKTIYAHDPFGIELLKMTRRGDEVVLYSIGPDLEDNDGLSQEPSNPKYDITFVLKAPAKAP